MSIIKLSFITLAIIFIVITPLNAHENDSSIIRIDTCTIFLNINENINALYSEIETIKGKELDQAYSINLLNSLRGKMNGVEIQTGTWGNNASSVFFTRGERNLCSSNQLLVVLDGIPITNQLSSRFGLDLGNLINDWNIDDIESISVLKSGQAASLYGNQAGNGAIIIRTKKAKEKGLHVDFNTSFLASQIADFPEFQNSYGQGNNGQFEYFDGLGGGINDGVDFNWGPPLDIGLEFPQFDGSATGYINGEIITVRGGDIWAREQATLNGINSNITPTPWVSHPDNMKDYFKTAMTYSNNIGISWVNKYGGIRFSYTNVQADNVTPNSKLKKNTISTNLNYTFFDRINLFGSINNTVLDHTNLIIPEGYDDLNPMTIFPWLGRQVDMNSLKDYWQAGQENVQQFNYIYNYENNPWFLANEYNRPMERNNLFASYGIKLELIRGFSINYLGGINNIKSETNVNYSIGSQDNLYGSNGLETIDEKNVRHNLFINLDFKIGKNHFINSFAGFYKNENNYKDHYDFMYGDPSATATVMEYKSTEEKQGYYGGLSYSCYNILFTRLTLSSDTYPGIVKQKTPIFPAFSAGLEFQDLLKMPHIISRLNFHTGYSKVGLNIVPINYVTQVYYTNNNTTSELTSANVPSNYSLAENPFPTITERSFGTVLEFMKNRIMLQANWYSSKTENGLVEIEVAAATGYISSFEYNSSVENKGFEFNLTLIPLLAKNVSWRSEITYFKNKNKVVDLGSLETISRSGSWNVDIQSRKGLPVSTLYGPQFLRYEDQIVFNNGIPQADPNYTTLGDVNPDYIMYFSNYLNVYKFKISLILNYSHGGVYYSPFFRFSTMAGSSYHTINRESGIVGQGVKWDETSNSYIPNNIVVEAEDYYYGMSYIDEYSIMDATSLSIDEISISYDFHFMDKIKLSCTLFGQNIYTWAKNKDYNQSNMHFGNNQFYRGINDFSLPNTRTFGLKLQLKI